MFSLLMFQKKHTQNQTTSYHLYYHPPSPGHHHLCFNCCVTSSHCLAPIPTPASLLQPQGLWDPLSPTNFWIELLFTQQASLYAFVLCENDSQTGMSGGHLPASALFSQLLFKNCLLFCHLNSKENIFLQSTIIKSWSFITHTGRESYQSPLSAFASFSQIFT